MNIEKAKGTKDFLPEEQILRNSLIDKLRYVFELYGFSPMQTPALERYDVLSSKYTGGDEILKEVFKLTDQGKRQLALRYDLTVPLARVIAQNPTIKLPFKRYQIGDVWRDGPIAKSRYRQFTQCDVDIIGSKRCIAEAELLSLTRFFFDMVGLKTTIRINNRQILNALLKSIGIPDDKLNNVILSIDKLDKLSKEDVVKEIIAKGITKETAEKAIDMIYVKGTNREKLKKISKIVPKEIIEDFKQLLSYLSALKVKAEIDFSLARGLSYYTKYIFEVFSDQKPGMAIAAGGRYDNMIKSLIGSKQDYPAVGISFGLDRIYDIVAEKSKSVKKTATDVLVIPIHTTLKALPITQQLRKSSINTEIDLMQRGISKNLNYANSLGIPFVVIVGEEELKKGKLKLKNMSTGKEELLLLDKIIGKIKNGIKKTVR